MGISMAHRLTEGVIYRQKNVVVRQVRQILMLAVVATCQAKTDIPSMSEAPKMCSHRKRFIVGRFETCTSTVQETDLDSAVVSKYSGYYTK